MYLVDANILVYATDDDSEHHDAARDWLDEHTAGVAKSVGLPWPTLLAYLRLVTNPRIYSPPATSADAWQRVEDWLSRPAAWIPVPGPRHQQILAEIVQTYHPAGNLTAVGDKHRIKHHASLLGYRGRGTNGAGNRPGTGAAGGTRSL